MLGKQELKGKNYSVYCSAEEVAIVEAIKKRLSEEKQLKISNSEILKMAIRKLGEEYVL